MKFHGYSVLSQVFRSSLITYWASLLGARWHYIWDRVFPVIFFRRPYKIYRAMFNSVHPVRRVLDKFTLRAKVFAAEPLVWAMYLFLLWMNAKLRSTVYSNFLNAPGLNIGPGCSIRGMRCISMGRSVSIFGGLWLEAVQNYRGQSFDPKISVGDRVAFSKDVHISCIDRVDVGNDVLFGSRVYVSDHNHGRYAGEQQSNPDEPPAERELALGGAVIIEDNVWIGDNVVIVGPTRIGAGTIVAANSVVKGDIPPFMMIAGAPAKPIKQFDPIKKVWSKV